jgi:heptose-I-phosphate ethanolaminephosphotransferase
MKIFKHINSLLRLAVKPLNENAFFAIMMYALGIICALCTLPNTRNAQLYDNLFYELFFDIYILCAVLSCIPLKVRRWIKMLLYIVLYAVALVDVFCFVKYDSTLNPSILMLVGETDSREAGEFLTTIFSSDIIFSRLGWILLFMLLNFALAILPKYKKLPRFSLNSKLLCYVGIVVVGFVVLCGVNSWENKAATYKLMTRHSIGEVEHTLTEQNHAQLYVPIYRLVFSVYANSLAANQVDQLLEASEKVTVDSCSYKSPTIVLIIGESYAKNHSQQYGYFMDTTPNQVALEKNGGLVKFDDVVACWNLTSYVFKNVLSTHVVGQKGEWCDYPLFPQLFRKAGYKVSFLTNQFLSKAKEAVYDFSGGVFLNNPQLSKEQFDIRNDKLYRYDSELLGCYDEFVKEGKIKISNQIKPASTMQQTEGANLVIFHLLGQHVTYKTRYPRNQTHFWASSYEDKRPELSDKQRKILSQYDNAVLYNDSIVNQIVKRFEDKNAIVIYMPDHGEECYEENRGFICRNHSAAIDWPLAHYEFEIPFWVYCSPSYRASHPDIYMQIVQAKHRRFMTDALPHMLLYLAGIHAKDYHKEYNVLSPDYNESRPRILKNTADYDKIRDQHNMKKNK